MTESNYEIIKIDDSSWRIEDDMVRMFLFEGADRAMLVDTGFGTGNAKEVTEGLTQKPVILVNTHADMDHTGCNDKFEVAYMHPAEYPHYFENRSLDAAVSPLWEGDIIDLGSLKFEVILIPGHTPGSIALLDRENKILVSGDSLSETPVFMFGPARNLKAYISSMEKLQKITDTFETVYPSHGPFPLGPERVERQLSGARRLLKGELKPQDPPFELPAKMYVADGASFFFN